MSVSLTMPLCFPSQKMYDDWKALARKAQENSSPCDDCTFAYAESMGDRCQRSRVRIIFLVLGKDAAEKLKHQTETTAGNH